MIIYEKKDYSDYNRLFRRSRSNSAIVEDAVHWPYSGPKSWEVGITLSPYRFTERTTQHEATASTDELHHHQRLYFVSIRLTLLFAFRRSDIKFWSPLACDAMVAGLTAYCSNKFRTLRPVR